MDHRQRDHRGLRAGFFSGVATALFVALVTAPAASGQTWTESGDAGNLVGSAQTTTGSGPLSSISGVLSGHDDVDIYCIQLTAVPPAGLPVVWVNCGGHADPTPYFFGASGLGLNANMTCAGGFKEAVVPNISLVQGQYFVAISHGDWAPQSAGGSIWQFLYSGPMAPNGPGAANPLTGWTGPSSVTAPVPYTLILNPNFTGFCDGPTPAESLSWGALKVRFGN